MGLLSSIGKMNNAYQGITSSAKQAQGYAVTNAFINHAMQKDFAQNAHQWEMEDLKKAGLNPALTATGGSGASASGGGSFGGSSGTSAGNPIETANLLIGMRNQTSATNSQNNLNDANAVLALANAKNVPQKLKVEMMNALSNQITAKANATNANTNANEANAGILGNIIGSENAAEVTKNVRNAVRNKNGGWFHFEVKKTR